MTRSSEYMGNIVAAAFLLAIAGCGGTPSDVRGADDAVSDIPGVAPSVDGVEIVEPMVCRYILEELVSNAMKFCAGEGSLRVSINETDNSQIVTISNTVPSVDPSFPDEHYIPAVARDQALQLSEIEPWARAFAPAYPGCDPS